jgi:hypothetical protein
MAASASLPVHIRSAIAAALFVALGGGVSAAAGGPFTELAGSWTGAGRIETTSGTESIRCRARYDVTASGESMQQTLVCASASYRFQVDSRVDNLGGRISGSWNDPDRGISGALTGTARPGRVDGTIAASAFSASLSVVTRGATQDVSIRTREHQIREVSVRLQKR